MKKAKAPPPAPVIDVDKFREGARASSAFKALLGGVAKASKADVDREEVRYQQERARLRKGKGA